MDVMKINAHNIDICLKYLLYTLGFLILVELGIKKISQISLSILKALLTNERLSNSYKAYMFTLNYLI